MAKAKPKDSIIVDFSKEEGGGGRFRVKEGDYPFKITKITKGKSKDKETPYVQIDFVLTSGKNEGKEGSERLYLTPKSLWKVRQLLEACGMSVPSKKVQIPFKKLKGKELVGTFEDDEYEGKIRSRISEFMDSDALSDSDEDDEDEEESEDEDSDEDDEDEDDEDEEDIEDVDLDEL